MRRFTLLIVSCLALLAAAAGPRAAATPPAPPAIELGETRPVETTLGNPALPEARSVWIDMIRGARRSLDLEHFYLSHRPGESLQTVLDEIGRAAARGVRVRLLLDAGMARTYPQPADSLGRLANVSVRTVNYQRLAGGVQHAKFMIVDDREAWIGSQNLDWRSLSQIHELGARLRDARLAGAIEAVFASDWAAGDTSRAFTPGPAPALTWPLRVFQGSGDFADVWLGASPRSTTPAGIPWDRDLLVQRIDAARHEIVAQVLQYGTRTRGGTDSTLHHALLAAAARGVRVKLVVSDWALGGGNEPALHDLASHANVEVKISRVPEWSVGYVPFSRVEHCKYMVADSTWLWLGTSNWEPSYFLNTRNLGLTIHDVPLALQARAVFATSWAAPGALPFGPTTQLPAREHGMTAPAGMKVYGE